MRLAAGLLVCIVLAAVEAQAQTSTLQWEREGNICYGFQSCGVLAVDEVQTENCSGFSLVAAVSDGWPQWLDAGNAPYTNIRVLVTCTNDSGSWNYGPKFFNWSGDIGECYLDANNEIECPGECPLAVGEKVIKSGSGTAPSNRCDGNCAFTKSGAGITMSGGYMAWYQVNGNCGSETGDGAQDNQNCLRTAGGTTYCLDTNTPDENCGTVNGEYVCLDGVPDGNCVFTPNGQAICDGGSQTNTPDETISTDSNDLDVFGDGNTGGTSGGSGNTSGTDDVGGTPGGGGGTGDGGQPGDCDGTNCQGQLPGANEAVDDFGTLFSNFYGRVEAAPVIAAFGGIPGSLPSGSCAAVDSDPIAFLNNQVLSLDVHCSMWQEIEPILSGVMLAIWALLGGLIILRA